jgi:hypothetical protein
MTQTQPLPSQPIGSGDRPVTWSGLAGRLREAAARHGEEVIAEIPATLRRFRLVLAIVAVAVPAFLFAILLIAAAALHVHF